MLDKTREQLVRDLIAAKNIMDDARSEHEAAKERYRDLESQFCAMHPLPGNSPEPVVCGETFIKPGRYWADPDSDHRLEFFPVHRVPTSE